jgi:Zn-dependent peptidase ImmA (M78 family)
MSADWKKAKTKAHAVREQYAADEPPVNLFEIAAGEGMEILYFSPDAATNDISGLLNKEKKQVFLNVQESAARQNFTLAHELAHYFLDHKPNEYGVYRRDSLHDKGKPDKEQEADCFAAELLMPQELITKVQTKYDLFDDDAPALSRLFGVSSSAMRYRLKGLKNDRVKK